MSENAEVGFRSLAEDRSGFILRCSIRMCAAIVAAEIQLRVAQNR